MTRTATIPKPRRTNTQNRVRILAKTDPRKRDEILVATGQGWSVIGLKASAAAGVFGWSETQESRIRSGQRSSAASYAAEAVYLAAQDARHAEAAGYSSAHIEVTLKSIAMWPELEKLTTEELHRELRRTIAAKETRANGECNNLEADYLDDDRVDLAAMRDAHTRQAAASERIVAITQVLTARGE